MDEKLEGSTAGWISIPFPFFLSPFSLSYHYCTSHSCTHSHLLKSRKWQSWKLKRAKYPWSPDSPKWQGKNPMGSIGWLCIQLGSFQRRHEEAGLCNSETFVSENMNDASNKRLCSTRTVLYQQQQLRRVHTHTFHLYEQSHVTAQVSPYPYLSHTSNHTSQLRWVHSHTFHLYEQSHVTA